MEHHLTTNLENFTKELLWLVADDSVIVHSIKHVCEYGYKYKYFL